MRKTFIVLIGVLAISLPVRSQTYVCYNDSTGPLTKEWTSGCTYAEITANDASEGTKCLDYTYSQYSFAVHYPAAWTQITKRFDASTYKYIQFACKISAEKTVPDTLSFWCIHCDPGKTRDLFFTSKFAFKPTTSWQVIKIPMSAFAKDPVDMISSIVFLFSSPDASCHFYVDNIQFTNNETGIAGPLVRRGETGRVIFPPGGAIEIETYSLSGTKVACRIVERAANSGACQVASQYAEKKLPAGIYIIKQRLLGNATVSKFNADRIVVVGN